MQEVVLGFGLCPWAEPALRAGRVSRRVFLGAELDVAAVLPAIEGIEKLQLRSDACSEGEPSPVEVGLFLFPDHTGGWSAFDAFAERLRRADRARRDPACPPPFLIATFHPEAPDVLTHPRQLAPFLRRSPDPMLQLVRTRALDRLKAHHPAASEDLAAATFAALSAGGAARARALTDVVRDIQGDRDRERERSR